MVMRHAVVSLILCLAASAEGGVAAQDKAGEGGASAEAQAKTDVEVTLSRSSVALNETFNVRFTTESEKPLAPDWSPLSKDFRVVVKSRGTRKTKVNGVMRSLHEWNVSLQPKRVGNLKIPPLQFGALRSLVATVEVRQPPKLKVEKPAAEFFVEVDAQPRNPYVQAQVLFTMRVFMLHNLNGSLMPPKASDQMIIEPPSGNPRNYRKNHKGRQYQVHESQLLIYPQKSGDVKISPVSVSGTYVKHGKRFAMNTHSRSLSLEVRPIPASFPGKFWLPAEKFNIKEQWSAEDLSEWRAGEPITRMLSMEVSGLLAKQVPEVDLSVGDGFRFYIESADFENKRSQKTNVGQRRQSTVLIPAQPGSYTLPAIKVPWWNTRADRLEFARLPEKNVVVKEAAFGELTVAEHPLVAGDDGELGQANAAFATVAGTGTLWFWVSVALLVVWLVTVALMWRGKGVSRLIVNLYRRRTTLRERRKTIRQACRDNDAAAARDALMQWVRQAWADDVPSSLGRVGARFGDMGDDVVERQILRLERALYARDDKWDGTLLWDALQEFFSSHGFVSRDRHRASADGLEPLHRL